MGLTAEQEPGCVRTMLSYSLFSELSSREAKNAAMSALQKKWFDRTACRPFTPVSAAPASSTLAPLLAVGEVGRRGQKAHHRLYKLRSTTIAALPTTTSI